MPAQVLSYDGTAWLGGPAPGGGAPPVAGFKLRETKPTADNSGLRIPESELVVVDQVVTSHPAGTTVKGRKFPWHHDVGSGDGPITYEDCLFTMDHPPVWPPSSSTANTHNAVRGWGAHAGARYVHCEFRPNPAYLSHNTYGPQGGDLEFSRCKFRDCVDFIVFQGFNGGSRRGLRVEGCYFESPLFYSVDPRQNDGTHPDNMQLMGNGDGIHIVGNFFTGGATSCLLFGANLDGGFRNVFVEDNWMLGDPDTGSTINWSAYYDPSTAPHENITIIRNRISSGGRTPGFLVRNNVRDLASVDLGLDGGGRGNPVLGRTNVYMDPTTHDVLVGADGNPMPYPVSNGG